MATAQIIENPDKPLQVMLQQPDGTKYVLRWGRLEAEVALAAIADWTRAKAINMGQAIQLVTGVLMESARANQAAEGQA